MEERGTNMPAVHIESVVSCENLFEQQSLKKTMSTKLKTNTKKKGKKNKNLKE